MRGKMMGRISSDDYQRMLDAAGDEAEAEADDAGIAARLNIEGREISEAERAAGLADAPRVRGSDGGIVGIEPRRPLTPAALQFARNVVSGMSRRDAYRQAYPNAKGTDQTISASAHKLSRDPRVAKIIETGWEETTEALAEDAAAQRRYVARSLVALSKAGKQEGSRLKALELLGRAAGMFRDQQPAADKPLTADELRKELAGHLRLVSGK